MVAFIDEYRSEYGVEPICRVLPIAPSTYLRAQGDGSRPDSSFAAGAARRSVETDTDRKFKRRITAGGEVGRGMG